MGPEHLSAKDAASHAKKRYSTPDTKQWNVHSGTEADRKTGKEEKSRKKIKTVWTVSGVQSMRSET